ncbi:hypothetical protein DPMN_190446 [Dreissena polymorpha]|uniref:Uncharacterized protein n=1 Tax=Dreissena polymorpha TaxID=45954 RepID=A0A9D4DTV8_DREPO|nr:hypothetical protein DPMN_190446 [Dreissena polymorpha]
MVIKPRPDTDKLSTAALSTAITILKLIVLACRHLLLPAFTTECPAKPRLSTSNGRFQLSHPLAGIIIRTNLLTRIHSPIPGGYYYEDLTINVTLRVLTRKMLSPPSPGGHVFQPTGTIFKLVQDIIGTNLVTKVLTTHRKKTGTIFELIQESIRTNVLTKFQNDWTIKIIFRVLTRFYYSHIRKKPAPWWPYIIETDLLSKIHENGTIYVASRVQKASTLVAIFFNRPESFWNSFDEDRTIHLASLVKNAPPYDIIGTNIVTKFHEDRTMNEKHPAGGHVFQPTGRFELVQDIIGTNIVTIFHEDRTMNEKHPAGGHVFQPTGRFELVQDIIGTNIVTKFHDDSTINVASRVHITKNAPPPGGPVFQPTGIIFELVQNIIWTNLLTKVHKNQTINVASIVLTRKNGPPPDGNVFQATVTIFELVQDIAETNDLAKFH